MKHLLSAAIAAASINFVAPAAVAAMVTPGFNASLLSTDTVGARYRAFTFGDSPEHMVGVNDLGIQANRAEGEIAWMPGTFDFSFGYDSADGQLTSTFGGVALTRSSPSGFVSDVLQLTLSNRDNSNDPATFTISDLFVNGESLGGLTCANFCDWMVTDFAVLPALAVTGKLTFAGTMSGNLSEAVKFQVTASSVAPVPVPAALPLLLSGIAGLGLMARRRKAATV